MTSSYTPTEDSKGHQVWKPSVGIVFQPDSNLAHSYGGIIAALKDGIAKAGDVPKSYPHNFAGIIAAIQDLESAEFQVPVVPSPNPPGTEIDPITGDLNIIVQPTDGELWFDTRQGRLFVANDQEWWQTNGADGLAYVEPDSNPPPTSDIIPGQFWYEPVHGDLYVYDGVDWVLIANQNSAATLQTTGSLPLEYLAGGNLLPFGVPQTPTGYGLGYDINKPPINIDQPLLRPKMVTQEDYNQWTLDSLWDLDQATVNYQTKITIDAVAPAQPNVKDLWFDTADLTLSIYYDDGNSIQWVPVHSGYDTALALRQLTDRVDAQTDETLLSVVNLELAQQAIQAKIEPLAALQTTVSTIEGRTLADIDALENLKTTHQTILDNHSAFNTQIEAEVNQLEIEVNSAAATLASHTTALAELTARDVADAATVQTALDAITAINSQQQTELDACVNIDTLNTAIQEIKTGEAAFALRSGGTFTGGLAIEHNDLSNVGIDFSSSLANSMQALKFVTNGQGNVTIGANEEQHQLAINITGNQEIAVLHGTDKQLSVNGNGVFANQFKLVDFLSNDANGMRAVNIIDVKERLQKYQQTFEDIRSALVLQETFDDFKVSLAQILSRV